MTEGNRTSADTKKMVDQIVKQIKKSKIETELEQIKKNAEKKKIEPAKKKDDAFKSTKEIKEKQTKLLDKSTRGDIKDKQKQKKKTYYTPTTIQTKDDKSKKGLSPLTAFGIFIALIFCFLSIGLNIYMFFLFRGYRGSLDKIKKAVVSFYCAENKYSGCNLTTIVEGEGARRKAKLQQHIKPQI